MFRQSTQITMFVPDVLLTPSIPPRGRSFPIRRATSAVCAALVLACAGEATPAPSGLGADLATGNSNDGNCPEITRQPVAATSCGPYAATFSVAASGADPLTFRWQIETAPDVWQGVGNDPFPLPCGGFAYASMFFADETPIGVHPCPGVYSYQIRCVVSNACGSVASDPATLTIRPGDLNFDGQVNAGDLALMLGAWGASGGPADFNGDGVVNAADLALLLGAWGACP